MERIEREEPFSADLTERAEKAVKFFVGQLADYSGLSESRIGRLVANIADREYPLPVYTSQHPSSKDNPELDYFDGR